MKEFETFKVEIDYTASPFLATHNMPCAVCREKKAVLFLGSNPHDYFAPCRKCRDQGWHLQPPTKGIKGWLLRLIQK